VNIGLKCTISISTLHRYRLDAGNLFLKPLPIIRQYGIILPTIKYEGGVGMEVIIEGKNIFEINNDASGTCSYDCSTYS